VLNQEKLPCLILVLMGALDWLITVVGIVFFGASEVNPLFANLTQTNLLAFSGIKLSVTMLIGFMFYKGFQIEKTPRANPQLDKYFLQGGYFLSLAALSVVVTNNIIAIVGV